MSAIGAAYMMPRAALPELARAAREGSQGYNAVREKFATEIATYAWSGYVLAALLPILQVNYGIDLLNSENAHAAQLSEKTGSSHIIFTYADKDASLARLNSASFDAKRLRTEFEAFNATSVSEAEEFMPAGIAFLHDVLERLTPEHVVLLVIG